VHRRRRGACVDNLNSEIVHLVSVMNDLVVLTKDKPKMPVSDFAVGERQVAIVPNAPDGCAEDVLREGGTEHLVLLVKAQVVWKDEVLKLSSQVSRCK